MKIGVVTDNYKLPLFRKKLTEAGYIFQETPFTKTVTSIFIFTEAKDEVKKICEQVEVECKQLK